MYISSQTCLFSPFSGGIDFRVCTLMSLVSQDILTGLLTPLLRLWPLWLVPVSLLLGSALGVQSVQCTHCQPDRPGHCTPVHSNQPPMVGTVAGLCLSVHLTTASKSTTDQPSRNTTFQFIPKECSIRLHWASLHWNWEKPNDQNLYLSNLIQAFVTECVHMVIWLNVIGSDSLLWYRGYDLLRLGTFVLWLQLCLLAG